MASSWSSTLKKAAARAQEKASKIANEVSEKGIGNVVSTAASDLKNTVKEDGVYNTVVSAAKAAKLASREFAADVSDSGWLLQAMTALENDDSKLFQEALSLDLSGSVYSWSLSHKLQERVGHQSRQDGLTDRDNHGMTGLAKRTPIVSIQELDGIIPTMLSVDGTWPATLEQLAKRCKKVNCLKVLSDIDAVCDAKLLTYCRNVDGRMLLLHNMGSDPFKDKYLLLVKEVGMVSSEPCFVSAVHLKEYVCKHDESFGVEMVNNGGNHHFVCGRCKTVLSEITRVNKENAHLKAACNQEQVKYDKAVQSGSKDSLTEVCLRRSVTLQWLIDFTTMYNCWEWSTQKVRDDIVYPQTSSLRCSLIESLMDSTNTGIDFPSLKLDANHTLLAEVYVCHAWAGRWGDLVEAAQAACCSHSRLWIDVFAVCQWPHSYTKLDFESVIKKSKGMLVVNGSSPSIAHTKIESFVPISGHVGFDDRLKREKREVALFRLWCISEIIMACKHKVPLVMMTGKRRRKPSTSSVLYKANKVVRKVMGSASLEKPQSSENTISRENFEWYQDKKLLIKFLFLLDMCRMAAASRSDDADFLKSMLLNECSKQGLSFEELRVQLRGTVVGALGFHQFQQQLQQEHVFMMRAALGSEESLQLLRQMCTGGSEELTHKLICMACFGGWLKLLQEISSSVPITAMKPVGSAAFTPLTCAAAGGHVDVCEFLVNETLADVNGETKEKVTPLMYACQVGDENLVRFLLGKSAKREAGRLNSEFRSHLGSCDALFIAVQFGNLNVLKELVRDQEDGGKSMFLNCRDNTAGEYLLHCAAHSGHTAIVQYLFSVYVKDGDEDISFFLDMRTEDSRGMTPLMLAASGHHTSTVRALLEAGADATVTSASQLTALHFACMVKSTELEHEESAPSSHLLDTPVVAAQPAPRAAEEESPLDSQALDTTKDEEPTYLPLAVVASIGQSNEPLTSSQKHDEIAVMLIKAGCDMEAEHDKFGWRPLFWAAHSHNHAVMKALIDHGCDVKHTCVLGTTPLMASLSTDHSASVRFQTASLLLDAGVNVNAIDRCTRRTALKWASSSPALCHLLSSRGALSTLELESQFPDTRSAEEKLSDLKLEYNALHSASTLIKHLKTSGFNHVKGRSIIPGGWPTFTSTLREMAHV